MPTRKVFDRKFKKEEEMTRLNTPLDPSKIGKESETLDNNLHRMIVGQDEAIDAIVKIYQMYLTALNQPGRPVGNFLFLGPTGTGKTRVVEATAEALLKNPRTIIKIDCAEFQHSHEIAKLIGSPPGYLGHRETHPLLSQEVLNQFHSETTKLSFVLFDEIEKASDALWNLLLGILDKATLTLGDNRKVDFSRAMIFMTSNLGAAEVSSLTETKIGFCTKHTDRSMGKKIERTSVEAARRKFTPEFMNRLDKVVTFQPLGSEQLSKVLDIELNYVQQRIFNATPDLAFVFTLSDQSKNFVLEQGTDVKYGARHLKRAIERLLVQPISNLIATKQVRGGDWIRVDFDFKAKCLIFTKEAERLPIQEMVKLVDASITMPEVASAASVVDNALIRTASAKSRRY